MDVIQQIKERVKPFAPRIVLPEPQDDRILRAAARMLEEGFVRPLFLGDEATVRQRGRDLGLVLDGAPVIDIKADPLRSKIYEELYERFKNRGRTPEDIEKLVSDPLYFGALMVRHGDADGQVAGSIAETAQVIKAAMHALDLREGVKRVSGAFLMVSPNKDLGTEGACLFADCAVNPQLNGPQLASVAVQSARTYRLLTRHEPRVAMLSFSTKGSARHERVEKVIEATKLARELDPTLQVDGELQADAALIAAVGQKKAPGSTVAGRANVLIFPDLDSGNIGYKLAQRYGGCEALGPIIQGFVKPVNDLSRGTTVEDIIGTVAVAALQSLEGRGA